MMYTGTRFSTRHCNYVKTGVYQSQSVDGSPQINLLIEGSVNNGIGNHIVSELTLTLTPEQWVSVTTQIMKQLKENEVYADQVGV